MHVLSSGLWRNICFILVMRIQWFQAMSLLWILMLLHNSCSSNMYSSHSIYICCLIESILFFNREKARVSLWDTNTYECLMNFIIFFKLIYISIFLIYFNNLFFSMHPNWNVDSCLKRSVGGWIRWKYRFVNYSMLNPKIQLT